MSLLARKARERSRSGVYHVLVMGQGGQPIFLTDEDKRKYVGLLAEYRGVCDYKLYAYALMENHVHLLINENEGEISRIMKRIGTSYVYWFNNKYNRQGQLFQDRFKSETVEDEQEFKHVLEFIHNKPVRDGLTADAGEYAFTSYRNYFDDTAIISDMAIQIYGSRQNFYDEHMLPSVEKPCLDLKNRQKSFTDEQIVSMIESETGRNIEQLRAQKVRPSDLDVYAAIMVKYNVSIRRLARITNLSISRLWRAAAKLQDVNR